MSSRIPRISSPARRRRSFADGSCGIGDLPARLDRDANLRKELERINPRESSEAAAPRPFDAHGNDGGTGLRRDERRAVIHLHERAGHRQPPFREDDDGLAGLDQAADELHRQRARGVDGEVRDEAQDQLEEPVGRHLRMHHEGGLHREKRPQQAAVEERFVIRHDERAGVAEDFGVAGHSDPEQRTEDGAQKKLEHARA